MFGYARDTDDAGLCQTDGSFDGRSERGSGLSESASVGVDTSTSTDTIQSKSGINDEDAVTTCVGFRPLGIRY